MFFTRSAPFSEINLPSPHHLSLCPLSLRMRASYPFSEVSSHSLQRYKTSVKKSVQLKLVLGHLGTCTCFSHLSVSNGLSPFFRRGISPFVLNSRILMRMKLSRWRCVCVYILGKTGHSFSFSSLHATESETTKFRPTEEWHGCHMTWTWHQWTPVTWSFT